jgi:hypothetical protein
MGWQTNGQPLDYLGLALSSLQQHLFFRRELCIHGGFHAFIDKVVQL